MDYIKISNYLKSIPNIKTKDIDDFNKSLIKSKEDVSDLKNYVLKDQLVHRTYFQVSMKNLKTNEERLDFVEQNSHLLQDWWHVDQLTQFLIKPIDYNLALSRAKTYITSKEEFLRRFGYTIFISGLQKNKEHTNEILSLMKDDASYYVQMAQAWLICDLAVFNIEDVIKFIEETDLDYNIIGKAIQKIIDSFRIKKEFKEYLKQLRNNKK